MNPLLQKIKDYFTPHQENDYTPHFSATNSILFISSAMVVVFLFSVLQYSAISSGSKYIAAVISGTLVDITNEKRVAYGKGTLVMNPVLVGAAQAKANDMAEKSYFAHTSPEGITPWHWFEKAGYTFSYAGENLAINFSDSIGVGEAWMNSPGHRANILNDRFTEIGIATSRGVYKGQPTIFVVQLFGKPSVAPATPKVRVVLKKEISQLPEKLNVLSGTPLATTTATITPLMEVAGATLETVTVDDMFISVKNTTATSGDYEPTIKTPEESLIARILVSPQTFLSYAYALFGALIVLALALDTFIEIRRRHLIHFVYAIFLWIPLFAILYIGGAYIMTPQTILTYAYVLLGLLISLALAINTFVEIRRKHTVHIVYALLLWILLFAILYMAGEYVFPDVTVLYR